MSQQMFKMSSFCLDTCVKSLAPLLNGSVNNTLFHAMPDTAVMFCAVRALFGLPLPFFRSVEPVSQSFFMSLFKPPFFNFFPGNSAISLQDP
jgi:hypothetical protein